MSTQISNFYLIYWREQKSLSLSSTIHDNSLSYQHLPSITVTSQLLWFLLSHLYLSPQYRHTSRIDTKCKSSTRKNSPWSVFLSRAETFSRYREATRCRRAERHRGRIFIEHARETYDSSLTIENEEDRDVGRDVALVRDKYKNANEYGGEGELRSAEEDARDRS